MHNAGRTTKDAEETKRFFATVQNKLHWAITGQTATEIIHSRADSQKQNMGLTSWKNAPGSSIRKPDVSIARNYVNEEELDGLNRIVTMYLDYAEMQARNRKVLHMQDWIQKLDAFLQFNEREFLDNPGKIIAEITRQFAETEFEKYRDGQDRLNESNFDKEIMQLESDPKRNETDARDSPNP